MQSYLSSKWTTSPLKRVVAVLEEHSDDSHHRKSAIGQLGWKLLRFLGRVGWSQDLKAKVSRRSSCARRLILGNLAECHVGQDLSPACCRHLGNCRKSVRHIGKLQAGWWRKVSRQLSSDPESIKCSKKSNTTWHDINAVVRTNASMIAETD